MVTSPLQGLRVLDLTRFVSGSYATMMLGMLGAEVIKVESLDGDPYRSQGTVRTHDQSVLFLSLNSAKRSIAVDFKTARGRDVLERLLATSDFFVENSRPGALTDYGLDYDAVHARHPGLVYGSISGYGDVGPDASRGGFDLVLQAESGLMSVTGTEQSGPVKVGAPVLDIGAGLCCVVGLLAAHAERLRTGQGRLVNTSLFEFALASLSTVAADYLVTGAVPGLLGTHSPTFAPYGNFKTADGWLVFAGAGSEEIWVRACGVFERADLVTDERFATNAQRVAHRDELTAEIESVLATNSTQHWLDGLSAAGVPASRVRDVGEALSGEQASALGIVQEFTSPDFGDYRAVASPIRFEHRPLRAGGASPLLGADTASVLAELGYDEATIAELSAEGVVACR